MDAKTKLRELANVHEALDRALRAAEAGGLPGSVQSAWKPSRLPAPAVVGVPKGS